MNIIMENGVQVDDALYNQLIEIAEAKGLNIESYFEE